MKIQHVGHKEVPGKSWLNLSPRSSTGPNSHIHSSRDVTMSRLPVSFGLHGAFVVVHYGIDIK